MNREEYNRFREQILEERDVVPLGGMDPFTTMDFLKEHFTAAASCSEGDTLDLWARMMQVEEHRDNALATRGVRATIQTLFNLYADQGKEFWLPEDVYPYYWQAAEDNNISAQSFKTLPAPDFTTLDQAGPNSVVLLSNPATPLGRTLRANETDILRDWLGDSAQRRIVLDSVYSYSQGFDESVRALYDTGQCVIAHSLSKAWLERGVFGIMLVPESDRDIIASRLESPPPQSSTAAYTALLRQPDLPEIQTQAFREEWKRLAPHIRTFAPDFQPPESGYFAVVKARADHVLENYNTLIIPASVFGSAQDDLSVVSCLDTLPPRSSGFKL